MQIEVGMILTGKISGITGFGAFVELQEGKSGMVHISEVAADYVSDINEYLKVGQEVKVKVISVSQDGKISLSIRRALLQSGGPKKETNAKNNSMSYKKNTAPTFEWSNRNESVDNISFEDMMSKFKQSSDERMSGIKKNDSYPRRPRRNSKPTK